jgi:hypothetical protein
MIQMQRNKIVKEITVLINIFKPTDSADCRDKGLYYEVTTNESRINEIVLKSP